MKIQIIFFALLFIFGSAVNGDSPVKSKNFGTYSGILEAYTIMVEGEKVEVKEGGLKVFLSEKTVVVTITDSDVSQTYEYALISKAKTGLFISLSNEKTPSGGEIFIYKKGDKIDLIGTIFGRIITLIKQK